MKLLIFLHVLGVILFLGNIITAAFWKVRAEVKKDLRLLHETVKNVMLADYIFTLPGIALILISGHRMAYLSGYSIFDVKWLAISYSLFILTGLIWLFILLPSQYAMIKHSKQSIENGALIQSYKKASMIWNIFGIIATLIPIIILFFMLLKPH